MKYDLFLPPAEEPVTDLVFQIAAHDDTYETVPRGQKSIISVPDREGPFVYCCVLGGNEGGDLSEDARTEYVPVHSCPLGPDHVTGWYWKSLDIAIGEVLPTQELVWPFEDGGGMTHLIMKADLGEELHKKFRGLSLSSNLRGFDRDNRREFPLQVVADALKDYRIPSGEGNLQMRGLATAKGKPNKCPYCGKELVTCPGCGAGGWSVDCPFCEKELHCLADEKPTGLDDRRLILSPPEQRRDTIWNGETWDGADFIGRGHSSIMMVTKRVVDYLLSVHATSFKVIPVIVDTAKMSDQQRRWMDEARRMPS